MFAVRTKGHARQPKNSREHNSGERTGTSLDRCLMSNSHVNGQTELGLGMEFELVRSTTGTSCTARARNKMWTTLRVDTQFISACTRSHSPEQ